MCQFLKVFLRDRYLTYMSSIGIGGGLSIYTARATRVGSTTRCYLGFWEYQDLHGGNNLFSNRATSSAYVLIIALVLLGLAHLFYINAGSHLESLHHTNIIKRSSRDLIAVGNIRVPAPRKYINQVLKKITS